VGGYVASPFARRGLLEPHNIDLQSLEFRSDQVEPLE